MTDKFIDWDEVDQWHADLTGLWPCGDGINPPPEGWPNISKSAVIGERPYHHAGDAGEGVPVLLNREVSIGALTVVAAGHKRNTVIGRSYIGSQVHVGHDTVIGDGCDIHAGTIIGGFVTIEDDVKIGIGAKIRPHRKIGKGSYIGMGSVVTKDVPPGEVWFGSPAGFGRGPDNRHFGHLSG